MKTRRSQLDRRSGRSHPATTFYRIETLAERDRAFQEQTIARDGFEVLKAQAERERAELEGYAAKKK